MRRALTVALTTTLSTLLIGAFVPAPAKGGGPTSVLLASPTQALAGGLYHTDPRYAELESLLHGAGAVRDERAARPADLAMADYLNITWMVHDVHVWRTDTLVLDAPGGPWISTRLAEADGTVPIDESWRALRDGHRIRELVASVLTNRPAPTERQERSDVPSQDDADTVPAQTRTRAAAPASSPWISLSGWRWAVPGLVLGLLIAGLAGATTQALWRPARPAPARPAQRELIDGPPALGGAASGRAASGRPAAR
jgi:hypothetical protein